MAKIRLKGERERLINGKWIVPGDVIEIPDKLLEWVAKRLGTDIEVVEEAQSGRIKRSDGTVDGGGSGTKKRSGR